MSVTLQVEAAIGEVDGEGFFPVGNPREWWGQVLVSSSTSLCLSARPCIPVQRFRMKVGWVAIGVEVSARQHCDQHLLP